MGALRCLVNASMSSSRSFLFAIGLALLVSGSQAAAPAPNAIDTVKRLYRDYSWEATMIDGPGPWIGDAPKSVLEQYLDGELAAIWVKSRACKGGDCAVDWVGYDPLWDSMDPSGYYNVTVESTNDPHLVKVEMDAACSPGQICKPVEDTRVRLTYFLQPTAQGWRIADIQSEVHGSLKAALLRAMNEH